MADLAQITEFLEQEIGKDGLQYLYPQLTIVRLARNLPKKVEDARLTTVKFFYSLTLIEEFYGVLSQLLIGRMEEKEETLVRLQDEIRFLMEQYNLNSWKAVAKDSKYHEIRDLLVQVSELRKGLLNERKEYLEVSGRHKITNICGLVIYPYSQFRILPEAVKEAENKYFGPNIYFNRKNKYTDSFILTQIAEKVLSSKRDVATSTRDVEKLLETPDLAAIRETYDLSKYDPVKHAFNMKDVELIFRHVLKRRPTFEEKNAMAEFYNADTDKYNVNKTLDWIAALLSGKDTALKTTKDTDFGKRERTEKKFLLGLSFMDKHRNQEIIGNVPTSSFGLFEQVMRPFHELKQNEIFISSAQFEIESLGLPEQAWIFDYTGVRTEILRSTLLMISDKMPKFDLLEACQRLINFVLSGRVDRNDIKYPGTNYIVTNKLPRPSWDYVSSKLVEVLEEALIYEEDISQRIIRRIFAEEDRSHLLTSKKFEPAYQVIIDYKKPLTHTDEITPETVTIYSRDDMDIQYRHVEAAGYPFYLESNEALEALVSDALHVRNVKSLQGNVKLRQCVYKIAGQYYICYFSFKEYTVSTLVFREVDLTKEGINPVEVIFRPQKFLDRGPEKNQMKCILDKARASDPKDLAALISNL